MKKITFLLLLMTTLLSQAQITNGTFDSDISGWVMQNTPTTFVHDNTIGNPGGSMKITTADATNTGIKSSPNATITAGDYIMKFQVYGTAGDKVQAAFYQASNGTVSGLTYTIQSTGVWEDYSTTFVGLAAENVNVRIVGKSKSSTYNFDNVTFELANTENGYVSNGDFETGSLDNWTHTVTSESTMSSVSGYNSSVAAAGLTFTEDQTLVTYIDNDVYDFGQTVYPDNIDVDLYIKTSEIAVNFQVVFKLFDENDANLGSLTTGSSNANVANTWEPLSFNKINEIGGFNKIQVRIKIKDGALNSSTIAVDDIVSSFSYLTLDSNNPEVVGTILNIYPNPVNNVLNISSEVDQIEVYDILGQPISILSNVSKIDTSNLKSGSYIARITSHEGKIVTKRFFKK